MDHLRTFEPFVDRIKMVAEVSAVPCIFYKKGVGMTIKSNVIKPSLEDLIVQSLSLLVVEAVHSLPHGHEAFSL